MARRIQAYRDGHSPGFVYPSHLKIESGVIHYFCASHRGGPELEIGFHNIVNVSVSDKYRPIHGGGVVYGTGHGGFRITQPFGDSWREISVKTVSDTYVFKIDVWLSTARIASQLNRLGVPFVTDTSRVPPIPLIPSIEQKTPSISVPPAVTTQSQQQVDAVSALERFWKLVQEGAMTKDEFETEKQRILRSQR